MSTSVNNPDLLIPDLNLLLQNKKYEIKTEINCIAVGTVTAFTATNSKAPTVSVLVNYLRVIYGGVAQNAPNSDTVNNKTLPYPTIINCPLLISAGGSSYLTFPVAVGDQCVILFNDRDIDNWWTTGSANSAPNSNRVHDLNDAMVFVGVRPQNSPIANYNMSGPQLTNGLAFISVEDKIKLSVNAVTLKQGLDNLFSALIAWVNTDATTPNPATVAAIQAAQVLVDEVLK